VARHLVWVRCETDCAMRRSARHVVVVTMLLHAHIQAFLLPSASTSASLQKLTATRHSSLGTATRLAAAEEPPEQSAPRPPSFMLKDVDTKSFNIIDEALPAEEPLDVNATPPAPPEGWAKFESALGLGLWSYIGLGTAILIIFLNQTLGPGWASRILDGESAIPTPSGLNLPYTVVPLNRPENLLQ
jgi:hypothetical protein